MYTLFCYVRFRGIVQVLTVCDIPERNTSSFGFVCVVLIFFVFVTLVLAASCKQQYKVQYELAGLKPENELNENLNGNEDAVQPGGGDVVVVGWM